MTSGSGGPIRVVIADDHPIAREGLRAYLESRPGIQVVGEASDGQEALEIALKQLPDVLLADITMPRRTGIEVTRQLASVAPRVRVIILSMHEDRECLSEAIRAGARGYLLKNAGPEELVQAIEQALAGETFVAIGRSRSLLERGSRAAPALPGLSFRERQVLTCLVEGLTSKETAIQLALSARTVESHRARIKSKLGIRTNAGLVRYAVTRGIGAGS